MIKVFNKTIRQIRVHGMDSMSLSLKYDLKIYLYYKMFAIKFRYTVNHSDEVRESIIDFFTYHNYDKLLLSQETATNQHYQAYVLLPFKPEEDIAKGVKRIRSSFTRKFEIKGNKCYSISQCEELFPVEYCAYLLKENPIFSWGLTEEEAKQMEEHQEKVVEEIEEKKKKKKLSTYKMVEEEFKELISVEDEMVYIDTSTLRQESGGKEELNLYLCYSFVARYFKRHELPMRRYQVDLIVDTLLTKYLPMYIGSFIRQGVERLSK